VDCEQSGGDMHLISTATGKLAPTPALRSSWLGAFSPDSRFLANEYRSEKSEFRVRLFDLRTQSIVCDHIGMLGPVAFSDDSRCLLTHDHLQGRAMVWNIESKSDPIQISKTIFTDGAVNGRLFSSHPLAAWELASGKQLWSSTVTGTFSPDVQRAFDPGTSQLLDGATGDPLFDFTNASPIARLDGAANIRVVFANTRQELLFYSNESREIRHWIRRRPERWWGFAWLWEFWLVVTLSAATLWSFAKDRQKLN